MSNRYGPRIVTDGLVLCLDAADRNSYPGTGTAWTDLSGNGNNGTLTNGPTFSSANKGNIVFDGTDDYVDCGTNLIPSGSSPRTLQVWCQIGTSGNSGYRAIINQGTYNANQQFQIGILNGTFNVNNYSSTQSDTINYLTNVWYFLVVSYNGTSYDFYRNGSYIFSSTITLNTTMGKMRLGANPNGNENINASISSSSIYNRALTASEIQQNYNATKGRFNL